MGVWNFHRRWEKIMPLSLLHKGRRKWMGRREESGTSPADGRAQNAGTPPPRAGRAAAQGTARPGGRALQASRPTGPGGPMCRPYKSRDLFDERRRGRSQTGPRAFARGARIQDVTLIRLAALGTFPLRGGRLAGGQRPLLQRGRNLLGRAGEDTRPYKIWGIFRFFRRGRRPRRPAGAQCAPLQRKRGAP